MTVDDDRLNAKTTGAVVIDIADIRARRDLNKNSLLYFSDPEAQKISGYWFLFFLFVGIWFLYLSRLR
jgi:hypothetical protein